MTELTPTATSIKLRFPEFASVDDLVIEFAIEEALVEIGEDWTTGYNVAINYLTAHFIASAVAASASGGSGGEDIASESIGRLSITYAKDTASSASADDKTSTSYGRRYVELLARNFGGPIVV
jgi:hypothetical protein